MRFESLRFVVVSIGFPVLTKIKLIYKILAD